MHLLFQHCQTVDFWILLNDLCQLLLTFDILVPQIFDHLFLFAFCILYHYLQIFIFFALFYTFLLKTSKFILQTDTALVLKLNLLYHRLYLFLCLVQLILHSGHLLITNDLFHFLSLDSEQRRIQWILLVLGFYMQAHVFSLQLLT